MGPFGGPLGASWGMLGLSGRHLEAVWDSWGCFWSLAGAFWPVLLSYCRQFAYFVVPVMCFSERSCEFVVSYVQVFSICVLLCSTPHTLFHCSASLRCPSTSSLCNYGNAHCVLRCFFEVSPSHGLATLFPPAFLLLHFVVPGYPTQWGQVYLPRSTSGQLYYITLHYSMLLFTIIHYTIPCHAMLCCAIL